MSHVKVLHVLACNQQAGNMLAGKVGPEPGDATAFDRAMPVYLEGTVFERPANPLLPFIAKNQQGEEIEPIGWYVFTAVRQSVANLANEFMSAGPYPGLNEINVSDQQVAALKQVIYMQITELGTAQGWRTVLRNLLPGMTLVAA